MRTEEEIKQDIFELQQDAICGAIDLFVAEKHIKKLEQELSEQQEEG